MREPKTKEAMAQSLLRFLRHKPLNRITVHEITGDCGISRMTFYYHFADIYDLARWACEREVRAMARHRETPEGWKKDAQLVLERLRANPDVTYNVYYAVNHDALRQFAHQLIARLIRPTIDALSPDLCLSDKGKDEVAAYYSHAAVGVLEAWLRDSMNVPTQTVVERIAVVSQDILRKSLENAAEAKW